MPKLSKYDEAVMQRELGQKRREYDLMSEVERLRYERSLVEETARQDAARAKLEFDAERLRTARNRMEMLQLSAVGGVASSESSAAPPTPTKFGPLDSSAGDAADKPPPALKQLDRRSAGMPPAGAEGMEEHHSQPRNTTDVYSTVQVERTFCSQPQWAGRYIAERS